MLIQKEGVASQVQLVVYFNCLKVWQYNIKRIEVLVPTLQCVGSSNLKIKIMKTYKLKGLEYYCVAFNKIDAVFVFLANKIGVTENNVEETSFEPNRDAIGKVFKSVEELNNFEIKY